MYQSLLHLTWIDKLLDNLRIIFTDLYGDQLRKPHTSIVECDSFDGYFDQQVKELEGAASTVEQKSPEIYVHDADPTTSITSSLPGSAFQSPGLIDSTRREGPSGDSTPDTSRPSSPANHILSAGGHVKGTSRRAKKAAVSAFNVASSGDERKPKGQKDTSKKMRRWDDGGMAGEDDGVLLDYSAQSNGAALGQDTSATKDPMDAGSAGTRTSKGQFILKDLDSEVHSMLQNAADKKGEQQSAPSTGLVGSGLGAVSGLFKSMVGGKVLTKADLEKPIKGMEEHLLKKNVAREAAVRLCEGVEKELIGVKTGNFESILSPSTFLLPI